MAKVLYFIAGNVPTGPEAADIAKLEAATVAPLEVFIRSNKGNADYGEDRAEPCDYVAGTLPASGLYDEVDEIDPDAIPGFVVDTDTQVIVSDGDTLNAVGGGTIAVAVAAGVATYTYTAP